MVATCDRNQQASDWLKQHLDGGRVSIFGDRLHVVLDRLQTEIPQFETLLRDARIQLQSARSVPFYLKDAFISVAQRTDAGTSHLEI
ncbi:hypothetical protein [Altericista sp. CCNU0014]|uniref:hypothetical protein n=1 Tax=Altericista sp. CCNU0014 TaxID=3082949 RepID=UPI00384DEB1A